MMLWQIVFAARVLRDSEEFAASPAAVSADSSTSADLDAADKLLDDIDPFDSMDHGWGDSNDDIDDEKEVKADIDDGLDDDDSSVNWQLGADELTRLQKVADEFDDPSFRSRDPWEVRLPAELVRVIDALSDERQVLLIESLSSEITDLNARTDRFRRIADSSSTFRLGAAHRFGESSRKLHWTDEQTELLQNNVALEFSVLAETKFAYEEQFDIAMHMLGEERADAPERGGAVEAAIARLREVLASVENMFDQKKAVLHEQLAVASKMLAAEKQTIATRQVYFVASGASQWEGTLGDDVKGIWGGLSKMWTVARQAYLEEWTDSPLSVRGVRQALKLDDHFSSIFSAEDCERTEIVASPLFRAVDTVLLATRWFRTLCSLNVGLSSNLVEIEPHSDCTAANCPVDFHMRAGKYPKRPPGSQVWGSTMLARRQKLLKADKSGTLAKELEVAQEQLDTSRFDRAPAADVRTRFVHGMQFSKEITGMAESVWNKLSATGAVVAAVLEPAPELPRGWVEEPSRDPEPAWYWWMRDELLHVVASEKANTILGGHPIWVRGLLNYFGDSSCDEFKSSRLPHTAVLAFTVQRQGTGPAADVAVKDCRLVYEPDARRRPPEPRAEWTDPGRSGQSYRMTMGEFAGSAQYGGMPEAFGNPW